MQFSDRVKKTVIGALVIFGIVVAGTYAAVRAFDYRSVARAGLRHPGFGTEMVTATASLGSTQPTPDLVNRGAVAVPGEKARSLEEDIRQLSQLLFGPKDAKGRLIVKNDEEMSFVYRQLDAVDHPERWNVSIESRRFIPEKVDGDTYVLTVPFDAAWGVSGVTFEPYADNRPARDPFQSDIEFGPLEYSDFVGGAFRWAGFKKIPRRDMATARMDTSLDWKGGGCSQEGGEGVQYSPLAQIGQNQVLRSAFSGCGEGGGIQYEVFGAEANYVFRSMVVANDELLRWTVERFREK